MPDPQIHSHVVITGAVRDDDRFVAVASRPIFRSCRELGAFYRSALCEAFSGRSREVLAACERFRAEHGRAPKPGELRKLKLENRRSKTPRTRADLDRAWRQTAEPFRFGPGEAGRLLAGEHEPASRPGALADRVEKALTSDRAVFETRDLRAVVLEQSAGELAPAQALDAARAMIVGGRVLPLEGGRMTTLTVRAREQAIERHAANLSTPADCDVGHAARQTASGEVAGRIAAPLSEEQELALLVLTGPERAGALVGPAGTGKGVVIDAAARAEQHAGRTTLGVAVSGSTAERLGTDSPSLAGQTLTVDSLIAGARSGRVPLDRHTTIFWDEAGMADTDRLSRLIGLIDQAGAKLLLIGDGQQLPAIGPGGMFDRLTARMPVVELQEVRRTLDPGEQKAWSALRSGQPELAMAHFHSQGRLHFADTREQAAENAVQAWAELTRKHDPSEVALIADASNLEIDRLNARAQHLRARRGELGSREVPLGSVHYGLRQGDRVAFVAQHYPPGQRRVENGTHGEILHAQDDRVTVALDDTDRQVTLQGQELETLRLGYAQHVYRQQGATVDHAIVLSGGWQTSKESAYVQASRARHGAHWHLAREELGAEGTDPDRIERLAQKVRTSRAQIASVAYEPAEDPVGRHDLLPAPREREIPTTVDRRELDTALDWGR